tara:strand:- start:3782 stop:4237 length:456 start_codon:yes stop_codon:yes gene_type:complete
MTPDSGFETKGIERERSEFDDEEYVGESDNLETDVNEAPVSEGPGTDGSYAFSYEENNTDEYIIGTVSASDDDGDVLVYSIDPASDTNGWYEIDAATGDISLSAAGVLAAANDYEDGLPLHEIIVVATDPEGLFTRIDVALTETDVNEAPS